MTFWEEGIDGPDPVEEFPADTANITIGDTRLTVDVDLASGYISGLHIASSNPEATMRTAFVLGQLYSQAGNKHMSSFYFEIAAWYAVLRLTKGERPSLFRRIFPKPNPIERNLAEIDAEIIEQLRIAEWPGEAG